MIEITEQLKQESEGLTADRGLEGAPSDIQTFEVRRRRRRRRRILLLKLKFVSV